MLAHWQTCTSVLQCTLNMALQLFIDFTDRFSFSHHPHSNEVTAEASAHSSQEAAGTQPMVYKYS